LGGKACPVARGKGCEPPFSLRRWRGGGARTAKGEL